jgi:energy-coupling factor transporter ATP-binding protein EcfA2
MLPEKITINHFRALRDCELTLSDNTVLVGSNGAGKSTVLKALLFFFTPVGVSSDDLQYGYDDDVSVTVVLTALSAEEQEQYTDFLNESGRLVVTKSGSLHAGAGYTVVGMKHPAFDSLRDIENGPARAFTDAFKVFGAENQRYELPSKPRSASEARDALRNWEREHPDELVSANVPFEFAGSTKTRSILSTRLVYVPAVHHAEQDFKVGRSPLGQMLEALVMPTIENRPEIAQLQDRWYADYQELFPVGGTSDLEHLADRLSEAVHEFVPGATVELRWADYVPPVPLPDVEPYISEDGVPTQISSQGHGLQRAMIISLLQAREAQLEEGESIEGASTDSHVLLLIEEPELYQHPPRARHFRRVLARLAARSGNNTRFRVVSSTHSPNFVSLDDLESIRIVRKLPDPPNPPRRVVTSTDQKAVADGYAIALGRASSGTGLMPRNLHALDSALREAFFARAIVLTEGVSDIGILAAEARRTGQDFEANGIVLASTGGKGQLPLAIVILKLLKIQSYIIFDWDAERQIAESQRLLRILGVDEAAIPAIGAPAELITASYAVMTPKIERVVQREVGAANFQAAIEEAASIFGIADDVMKNPASAAYVMESLFESGHLSPTVSRVVDAISRIS